MYITITRNYSVTLQHSKLQEKMRTAHSILQDEVNRAGNYACGNTEHIHNILNQSEHDWWNTAFSYGVYGVDGSNDSHTSIQIDSYTKSDFDTDSNWPQAIGAQARKDSDVILLAHMPQTNSVSGLSEDGQLIHLKHAHNHEPPKSGELWLICNLTDTLLFQSSGSKQTVQETTDQSTQHNKQQVISIMVGNSDNELKPGNQLSALDHSFMEGTQTGRVVMSILFIAKSVSKKSYSLFREYLTFSNGKLSSRREELVVGIENLQFEYGLLNDEKDIIYYSASQISEMTAWHEVLNVRVGVLFASEDHVLKDIGPYQFTIADQQVNVEKDKRRRVLNYFVIRIKSRDLNNLSTNRQ